MKRDYTYVAYLIAIGMPTALSLTAFISAIISENGWGLLIISIISAFISASLIRDYFREVPRHKLVIHIDSYRRIGHLMADANMQIIVNIKGEWVEITYPLIEKQRLNRLFIINGIKKHNV